jgi:hypothetical protein
MSGITIQQAVVRFTNVPPTVTPGLPSSGPVSGDMTVLGVRYEVRGSYDDGTGTLTFVSHYPDTGYVRFSGQWNAFATPHTSFEGIDYYENAGIGGSYLYAAQTVPVATPGTPVPLGTMPSNNYTGHWYSDIPVVGIGDDASDCQSATLDLAQQGTAITGVLTNARGVRFAVTGTARDDGLTLTWQTQYGGLIQPDTQTAWPYTSFGFSGLAVVSNSGLFRRVPVPPARPEAHATPTLIVPVDPARQNDLTGTWSISNDSLTFPSSDRHADNRSAIVVLQQHGSAITGMVHSGRFRYLLVGLMNLTTGSFNIHGQTARAGVIYFDGTFTPNTLSIDLIEQDGLIAGGTALTRITNGAAALQDSRSGPAFPAVPAPTPLSTRNIAGTWVRDDESGNNVVRIHLHQHGTTLTGTQDLCANAPSLTGSILPNGGLTLHLLNAACKPVTFQATLLKKRHQLWGAYIGYTPTEAFFLELPIPSYAAG